MPLINEKYFRSKDVKVFPCSYRNNYIISGGNYNGQSYAFDPESRLNTEYNYLSVSGKSGGHDNYIISCNPIDSANPNSPCLLKCVIGGYYFEINNFSLEDLKVVTDGTLTGVKNLYIKTRQVFLKQHTDSEFGERQIDSDRSTKVLGSWDSQVSALDNSTNGTTDYYFTGILCDTSNSNDHAGYTGELIVATIVNGQVQLNNAALLPILHHGSGNNAIRTSYYNESTTYEEYNDADGINSFAIGEATEASSKNSFVNGYLTKATGVSAHSEGTGYIESTTTSGGVIKYYTAAEGTASHAEGYTTKASGDYSHTEGYKTVTSGLGSHAEGKETEATGNYSHAEGSKTKAKHEGAHTSGQETISGENFQTVVGKYNAETAGQFVVGTGNDTSRKNSMVINNNVATIKDTLDVINNNNVSEFKVSPGAISASTSAITTTATFVNTAVSNSVELAANSISTTAFSYELETEDIEIYTDKYTLQSLNTELIADTSMNLLAPTLELKTDDPSSTKINTFKMDSKNGFIDVNSSAKTGFKINNTEKLILNNSSTKLQNNTVNIESNNTNIKAKNSIIVDSPEIETKSTTAQITSANLNINTNKTTISAQGGMTVNSNVVQNGNLILNEGNLRLTNDFSGSEKGYLEVSKEGTNKYRIKTNENLNFTSTRGLITYDVASPATQLTTISVVADGASSSNPTFRITNSSRDWVFDKEGSLHLPGTLKSKTSTLVAATMQSKSTDQFKIETSSASNKVSSVEFSTNTKDSVNAVPIVFKQYKNDKLDATFTALTAAGMTQTNNLQVDNWFTFGGGKITFKTEDSPQHNTGRLGIFNVNGEAYITSDGFIRSNTNIKAVGCIEASYFNATSDKRLKENILPFEASKSILDLPLYTFNFIGKDEKHIGCLAQDLQQIYPELVNTNNEGYLSIKESKLVYILLDEIKKLEARISQLEGR